ncbi:MAG: GNAT family N-acetyltransferase [Pseudomonadota bacterium]
MKSHEPLQTDRLIIRHWTRSEADADFLHHIMSNEIGRRFYPQRMTRQESDLVLQRLAAGAENGALTWGVACLKEDDTPLGFTGLYPVGDDLSFGPTVEIGWQYSPDHWGKGYASEAGTELLHHAFEDLDLPEVVAFAVRDNTASIRVMDRIGMHRVTDGDFDHPKVPDTHPHLKRHVLYRLTQTEWRSNGA